MEMKLNSKLIYSAIYNPESGTVTIRDWRKDEERISSEGGG